MCDEFTLLRALTAAIVKVRDTAADAAEAFKIAYVASVADKAEAKFAQMEAATRAAHAKHEMAVALSDAQALIAKRDAA